MLADDEIKDLVHSLVTQSLPITSMRGLSTDNFIPGQSPIQYAGPSWTEDEIEAAVFTMLRGKWLSAGENTQAFENEFSKVIDRKFALMCNSGSSANLLMFSALKSNTVYGFKDIEVITPVVCFPTTVAPIIQSGFKPKFIDVEMDTLNLDLDKLEAAITPKTKVLIFAHVLGNPPDMERVVKICKEHDLVFLEDTCDALDSRWNNKPLGSFGLMSSFSFYPAHHITTGEGGMVATDDNNLIQVLRSIIAWGRACACVGQNNLSLNGMCNRRFGPWLAPDYEGILDHKYVYQEVGYNLKPLDLQGAIGLVQLKKLPRLKAARQRIFGKYLETCQKFPELIHTVKKDERADVNWFGFPITVITDKFSRNDLVKYLEDHKIQTRNYFSGNILFHKPFAGLGNPRDYPNACRVMDNTFFIGVQPNMSDEMIGYVQKTLEEFLGRQKS